MTCTYFFILLVLSTFCDALPSKRNFDPDSLMQRMMFSHHAGEKAEAPDNPSVFGSYWGFQIHNPAIYLGQYGSHSSKNSFNSFHPSFIQSTGTFDTLKNSINTNQKSENTAHQSNLRTAKVSTNGGPSIGNVNGYGFNPTVLNQQLMHLSGDNSYGMLKGYPQLNHHGKTHDTSATKISKPIHVSTTRQGTSANKHIQTIGVQNTADGKKVSSTGSKHFDSNKLNFRFNADQLNRDMMSNVISANNQFRYGSTFREHGMANKLSDKTAHTKSTSHKVNFDATKLNSQMFNAAGYNPVYVNNNKHKRSNVNFNPNTMMSKFMELRTNIGSFGSYHPNDLATKNNKFLQESDNNENPVEFDPNGQSMFPSVQHTDWGFSIYNPLHSLEQYSGSNTGKGTAGPKPNTDSSAFNPNTLNDYLMSLLTKQPNKNDFNPNNLNNKFFQGLNYNPTAVTMKTVLPMFHENILLPSVSHSGNLTRANVLPGLGNSVSSQNGYVKNTHSQSSNSAVVSGGGENVQQVMPSTTMAPNAGTEYVANTHNGHQSNGKTSAGPGSGQPNFNFGLNTQHTTGSNNIAINGYVVTQTGATNTANVQATGVGSLGGSVHTNGNGYHQSMYQQGPSQGVLNNTSVLSGSGGTLAQTQPGALGSTSVQQTGLATTNIQATSGGTVGQTPNNNAQTSAGSLGSAIVQQTGSGSLGSNVISQTGAGSLGYTNIGQTGNSLGSKTVIQSGAGSLGSKPITQTNTGGLGSNTVSQTAAGGLGSTGVGQSGTGSLGTNTVSQTAAGSLGSSSVSQTGTGKLGSNAVTQTGAGTLGSNTNKQTNSGGLGTNTVTQTVAGGIGSQTVNQAGTGSLGSNTVSQTAAGSLGSTSVTQIGSGSIGSNTVLQTAAGSLGSTGVSQTGSGSLGSKTISQTAAGGLGSTSVSQIGIGTLGSNTVSQTSAGGLGSNSVTQTGAGSFGSKTVQQTNNGSLGSNNAKQTGAGSLGSKSMNQSGAGSLG